MSTVVSPPETEAKKQKTKKKEKKKISSVKKIKKEKPALKSEAKQPTPDEILETIASGTLLSFVLGRLKDFNHSNINVTRNISTAKMFLGYTIDAIRHANINGAEFL